MMVQAWSLADETGSYRCQARHLTMGFLYEDIVMSRVEIERALVLIDL